MSSGAINLESLVRNHLSATEDEATDALTRRLRVVRRRRYLTQSELEAVCRWKSARAIVHIRANDHHRVRRATSAAFAARNEQARLESLLLLEGVSVPMASAVLTLVDPKRYGVIDIRVWQLLHEAGAVTDNPRGVGFSVKNWLAFLATLRPLSRRLGVTVRDVERTLFEVHRARQEGTAVRVRAQDLERNAHLVGRLEPEAFVQRTSLVARVQVEVAHAVRTAPFEDDVHQPPSQASTTMSLLGEHVHDPGTPRPRVDGVGLELQDDDAPAGDNGTAGFDQPAAVGSVHQPSAEQFG